MNKKTPEKMFSGAKKIGCGIVSSYLLVSKCFGKNATDSVCSGHGICVDHNQCSCEYGYTGNECQILQCFQMNANDTLVCSGRGNCYAPDTCNCFNGYAGENCQFNICYGVYSNNTFACSSGGSCIGPNNCSCTLRNLGYNCEYNISTSI
jgi:hypothetical protein